MSVKADSNLEKPANGMGRRSFIKGAAVIAGAGATGLLPFPSTGMAAATGAADRKGSSKTSDVTAETTYGKVRGVTVEGIRTFKGIPYGGTTAGKNRFMPPTKPAAWTGVRDALDYGHISPQTMATGRIDYVTMIHWLEQRGGQSEDCLVLNIWTPGVRDGARRPVMFSMHGGGFTTGSGNAPGFDGHALARFGNCVVVTINHRLGCLGYIDLTDLGAPPEFANSGSAGMLDCVFALQWVRDNIENFGGDPANIMIYGQSGGGAKTSTVLGMPAAKGLYHRAVVQSGSALRLETREGATKTAERFLAQIGLTKKRITELQNVPFEMMIAAQDVLAAQTPPAGFRPVLDGGALPRHPFDPTAPDVSADIPVIIGTMMDDAALGLTNFDLDEAGLREVVRKLAGEHADHILAAYRKVDPDVSPFRLQARMLTDRGGRKNAGIQAERKAALHKAPAYLYRCDWVAPGYGGKFGAVHGIDVGLSFHNLDEMMTGTGPDAQALVDKFASMWVNFAKTGTPKAPGLPEWPVYSPGNRPTMIFGKECRVENNPRGELIAIWDEVKA